MVCFERFGRRADCEFMACRRIYWRSGCGPQPLPYLPRPTCWHKALPIALAGTYLQRRACGRHFVVATGIAADGSILIHDPSPALARGSLSEYLSGLLRRRAGGRANCGEWPRFCCAHPPQLVSVIGAVATIDLMQRLTLRAQSAAGVCGVPFDLLDTVDNAGRPAAGALVSRINVCDGSQTTYQVTAGTSQPFALF